MAGPADEINPQPPFPDRDQIATAVVTGEHPFNVPGFHHLFRGIPEVDFYPQHLDDFVVDWGNVRTTYGVVVFYNYHRTTAPPHDRGFWQRLPGVEETLGALGEAPQGVVVLHHALAAFPEWEFWSALTGIPHAQRASAVGGVKLSFGERVRFEVVEPRHPITRGLAAWEMYGETWAGIDWRPGEGTQTLLTTDHPKMGLKAMAWTHRYRNARVFCLQPGHNADNWSDPTFRTVLARGLRWAAGRLDE